ncbi:hypothetical protein AWB69_02664 [Caballeronia udeis]|uniref:Uncharacterized protein n=1 Tax=Caballeronia udeis TaxID=1232866 RepID=A0A158GHA1_9BURK|nr:hypothetical protein AWB69_02664 [Caballeronia udeis]
MHGAASLGLDSRHAERLVETQRAGSPRHAEHESMPRSLTVIEVLQPALFSGLL